MTANQVLAMLRKAVKEQRQAWATCDKLAEAIARDGDLDSASNAVLDMVGEFAEAKSLSASLNDALNLIRHESIASMQERMKAIFPERDENRIIRAALEKWCPWLRTEDEINGGDLVETISELYESVGGKLHA